MIKIHLYFTDGSLKIVSSWDEAGKYGWKYASVFNFKGDLTAKYRNY
jgi:hypothetical protein